VKFHNGKELTSADVVPSLQRWGRLATPGKQFWKNVEGVEAKDPYTVVMYLKDTSGALLMGLARPNNGAVIYPREVVEAAGDKPVTEYIGTGPYRFVEHKPDRHVKVARFKDYAARTDAPAASAASGPPTSTRSSSFPCRTWPCARPAWRPASTTTPSSFNKICTSG